MEIKPKLQAELTKVFEEQKVKILEGLKPLKAQDLKKYNEEKAKIEKSTFDDFVEAILVGYCQNLKAPEIQEQKKAEIIQELKDYAEGLTKTTN